ncbi:hypothetical protein [Microvirga sp. Mcv34]|uniref:hypothetical protein n=1 Tax=Microvirga sp. Mcv34 TaxID=2926016 RepID=UPI0021C9E05F|nr:hypothetical protein [Microvirga sp. Mcv34]
MPRLVPIYVPEPTVAEKRCCACGITKPAVAFWPKKDRLDGLYSSCRECAAVARAGKHTHRKKRPTTEEKRAERERAARRAGKRYRPRDAYFMWVKECAKQAREERRQLMERAKAKEREAKPWLEPGISHSESRRRRYQNDPAFNLRERVRNQFRKKRRSRNIQYTLRKIITTDRKSPTLETFLGYSASRLKQHIERQFEPGMNWERFVAGEIHIDHIVPVSAFDLEDEDDIRAAWALTNLRPMWAGANMRKGARRETLL